MILLNKKQFSLVSIINPSRQIYTLIVRNLPNSIFSKLDFLFLKNVVKEKILQVYAIKKKRNFHVLLLLPPMKNIIRSEILLFYTF